MIGVWPDFELGDRRDALNAAAHPCAGCGSHLDCDA